ncbi:MAG TPA: CoA pyrophosphatase [Acetobacteraceae bacterium]|jgi:8-oxo-dGTP pyrophosphatase MutT (NUDIX family)
MTAAELRARLGAIVAEPLPGQVAHGDDVLEVLDRPPIPAAVLVPVILGSPPAILLTKRNAHLNRHGGQVSFPGGRIDASDPDPEAAALREAREEVALDPSRVEIVGRMADYVTGTGYRITPVLALLPPGLSLRAAPDEVEAVFEFPIATLLDPDAPKRQRHHVRGVWREYWVWPHPEHYIWGATAAILVHLAQKLRALEPHAATG